MPDVAVSVVQDRSLDPNMENEHPREIDSSGQSRSQEHPDGLLAACHAVRALSYRDTVKVLLDEWQANGMLRAPQDWVPRDQAQKLDGAASQARLNALIKREIDRYYQDYLQKACCQSGVEQVGCKMKEQKKHLDDLLEAYLDLFSHISQRPKDTVFRDILIAERLCTWKKGRKEFTTKVELDSGNSGTAAVDREAHSGASVHLKEVPVVDASLLHDEYAKIATSSPPFWFTCLSKWQQEFIRANWEELHKKTIPSALRSVPGLANLSRLSLLVEGEEIQIGLRGATPPPIDLMLLLDQISKQDNPAACQQLQQLKDEIFRITCLNVASQIRLSLVSGPDHNQSGVSKNLGHEKVILLQSFLSPGFAATRKSKFYSDASDDDTALYDMREEAISLFQHALAHPSDTLNERDRTIFFGQSELKEKRSYGDFLGLWGFTLSSRSDQSSKSVGQRYNTDDRPSWEYEGHSVGAITLLSTNRPYSVLRHCSFYAKQTENNHRNIVDLLAAVARYLGHLRDLHRGPLVSEFELLVCSSAQSESELQRSRTFLDNKLHQLSNHLPTAYRELSEWSPWATLFCSEENSPRIVVLECLQDILGYEWGPRYLLSARALRLFEALQVLLLTSDRQGLIGDEYHHQSLIGVSEVVVVNCLGGTVSMGCKSAKDRTAAALSATSPALLSARDSVALPETDSKVLQAERRPFEHRPCLPRYGGRSAGRDAYVRQFSSFLKSEHHRLCAEANAPGVRGIQIRGSIPGDIRLHEVQNCNSESKIARLHKPKQPRRAGKQHARRQVDLGLYIAIHLLLDEQLQTLDAHANDVKHTADQERECKQLLKDWSRNKDFYFIQGISASQLMENSSFEYMDDGAKKLVQLLELLERYLLCNITDTRLKEYYLKLLPHILHHGGFLHASGQVLSAVLQKGSALPADGVIGEQIPQDCFTYDLSQGAQFPPFRINCMPLEDGFEIEECNTYGKRTQSRGRDEEAGLENLDATLAKAEGYPYYGQVKSRISVRAEKDEHGQYKLHTTTCDITVDAPSEGFKARIGPSWSRSRHAAGYSGKRCKERLLSVFQTIRDFFRKYFGRCWRWAPYRTGEAVVSTTGVPPQATSAESPSSIEGGHHVRSPSTLMGTGAMNTAATSVCSLVDQPDVLSSPHTAAVQGAFLNPDVSVYSHSGSSGSDAVQNCERSTGKIDQDCISPTDQQSSACFRLYRTYRKEQRNPGELSKQFSTFFKKTIEAQRVSVSKDTDPCAAAKSDEHPSLSEVSEMRWFVK